MIFDKREEEVEVLVRVMAGRLEGVTVSTLCRLLCEVEVEEEVDELRVESGEGRPRARRRRDVIGILIACACNWDCCEV